MLLAGDPGPRRSPGCCPRGSGRAKEPTKYARRERISRRAAIDNCCGVGRKLEPSAGPRYRAFTQTNYRIPDMTETEIESLEEEQLECQRQMWRWPIGMDEYDKAKKLKRLSIAATDF